jgi:protein gp37
MAANSAIEWTDHTWTVVVGCDAVSPACAKCYAALMAARLEAMGQEKYAGLATRVGNVGKWTGVVKLWEPDLVKPLTVGKASRWFLTSMGDVGHDKLTDEQVAELFGVMAVAGALGKFHREQDGVRLGTPIAWSDGTSSPSRWPNMSSGPHTFMVLSKRSARIAALLGSRHFRKLVSDAAYRWAHNRTNAGAIARYIHPEWEGFDGRPSSCWPMRNVFIGCTAENQERADELRPHMAAIAAGGWQTFVSYEPALGPVDWTGWEFLKQLISGGESGHGARPSHPDWHRGARDFAAKNGIAYLFKQWGEWASVSEVEGPGAHFHFPEGATVRRVGKKAAGRLLDGVEHNGFPEVSHA